MNWLLLLLVMIALCLWTWVILMATGSWETSWWFFGGWVLFMALTAIRNYFEEKKDKELWK